ncbi:right-handed parallel beta-helix repeat-containing protein [Meridianimarinicoccus sp. MJW13]|uniref:right-handed parallel beta-helix repeat-containing protein n=1 Tax=Meridianimarinicoccus sp. MJW13 TaxID=2720031 RepID=UPI00186642D4|nr:right-handed parallel beta-helix repeat-containing protein [Fluviibacterium sp. MJW13]
MATFVVTDTVELDAAFQAAADGDRIELAGGDYAISVNLTGRDFATGLTIASADPNDRAVLTDSLLIENCSGITFEGIDLQAATLAPNYSWSRVQLRNSSDITLRDMTIEGHIPDTIEGTDPDSVAATRDIPLTGYGYEFGVLARNVDGLVMEGVELADLRVGLRLNGATNVTIDDLDLHHTREGVNFNDVTNMVIENSYFHDLNPWYDPDGKFGDHPDMIQYWGVNSASGVHGITIRDNFFYQPEGARAQSIFGHLNKADPGVTATDFLITGNTIINASANAIKISDVVNMEISNNILLPNAEDLTYSDYPRISLLDVDNVQITGNTLLPRNNGKILNLNATEMAAMNVTESGNTLLSPTSTDVDYWKHTYDQVITTLPYIYTDPGPGTGTGGGGGTDPNDPNGGGGGLVDVILITGTAAKDNLTDRAYSHDAVNHFQGLAGKDKLTDTGGDDILEGGLGADTFIFDNRKNGDEVSHDLVMDLNFSDGDRLRIMNNQPGSYSDDLDPSNNMIVSPNGSSVTLRSLADLVELQAGATVDIAANATDTGVVLTIHDDVDKYIELQGILMSDLGLG